MLDLCPPPHTFAAVCTYASGRSYTPYDTNRPAKPVKIGYRCRVTGLAPDVDWRWVGQREGAGELRKRGGVDWPHIMTLATFSALVRVCVCVWGGGDPTQGSHPRSSLLALSRRGEGVTSGYFPR